MRERHNLPMHQTYITIFFCSEEDNKQLRWYQRWLLMKQIDR